MANRIKGITVEIGGDTIHLLAWDIYFLYSVHYLLLLLF